MSSTRIRSRLPGARLSVGLMVMIAAALGQPTPSLATSQTPVQALGSSYLGPASTYSVSSDPAPVSRPQGDDAAPVFPDNSAKKADPSTTERQLADMEFALQQHSSAQLNAAEYALVGSGGTTFETDNADGSQVFKVAPGYPDLGVSWGSSQGPIDFAIWLPFRGPVDGNNHPLAGNSYFGANKTVALTIHAFDVDDKCDGCANPGSDIPERDVLVVNGTEIDGDYLLGSSDHWSDTTFNVPTSLLRFQSSFYGAGDGQNAFQVLVDHANANHWLVTVGWAQLTLPSREFERPIVLLHGLGGTEQEMLYIKNSITFWTSHLQINPPDVLMPTYGGLVAMDGIDDDWKNASPQIDDFLSMEQGKQGWTQVNVIGHSIGGLVGRVFASRTSASVKTVVMIGTPNGGVPLADAHCLGIPWGGSICLPMFGGIRDIRTDMVQHDFNNKYTDATSVDYYSLAGTSSRDGCQWGLASLVDGGLDDGCVSIKSQEWLVVGMGHDGIEHGGAAYEYPVTHVEETNKEGDWRDRMLCLVMGPPMPCSDAEDPGSPTRSFAVPQAPETPAADASAIIDGTVGPGTTTHFPLAFEGSSQAQVILYTAGSALSASTGSTTLAVSPSVLPFSLAATMANPADGVLDVTNAGAVPVQFRVVVAIPTLRHLTVAVGSPVAMPGSPVAVDVRLSQAGAGDAPSVSFIDATGNTSNVTVTQVDPGEWTGSLTSSVTGQGTLLASVTQNGPRYASTAVTISSGDVSVSGLSQQSQDTNADGLDDTLSLSTNVTVQVPGTYLVSGQLTSPSGVVVGTASSDFDLTSGTQPVKLDFSGTAIYASGQSGPYRLAITVVNETGSASIFELADAAVGSTSALDYRSFQHQRISIDQSSLAASAVDTNGDGFYEGITLTGSVTVDTIGTYVIQAGLDAPNGTQVTRDLVTQELSAGTNSFTLTFDGPTIWKAGLDGPYTVRDLSVALFNDSTSTLLSETGVTTPTYTAVQFTPKPESSLTLPDSSSKGIDIFGYVRSNMPFELWAHFKPAGSSDFGPWHVIQTGQSAGDFAVWLVGSPDGVWEYYTIAVSGIRGREDPPTVPDAQLMYDKTAPTSPAGAVVPRTSSPTITIPFSSDDGAGTGVLSVAVHARYRPTKGSPWSPIDEYLGSAWPSDGSLTVTLPNGEGFYEFWTDAEDYLHNCDLKNAIGEARTHYTTGSDPSSLVTGLPKATSASFLDVPYVADFASGTGTVGLWQSFEPKGATTFGTWSKVGATTAGPPIRATLAADGTYQFFTVAADPISGTVEATPTLADASIVRDTAPPTSIPNALPSFTNISSAYVSYTTDAGGGSDVASVQIWSRFKAAGSTTYSTWQQVASGDPYAGDVPLSLGDGLYEFDTLAVDAAGNVETKTMSAEASTTLDTVPPTSQVGTLPATAKSISVPYTANDNANGSGVAKVKLYFRYHAPGSTTWTDWTYLKSATKSPISATVTNGDGTYQFYTLAVDAAGNTESVPSVTSASIVLDTAAPTSTLGTLPGHVQTSPLSIPFSATDDATGTGVASVELWQRYTVTGGTPSGNYSKLTPIAGSSGSFSVPVTQGGTYEFYAIAVDVAGNREAVPATPDATVIRDPIALASLAGPLAAASNSTSISVPYAVTGTGNGLASVQLWQRFGTGAFAKVKTATSSATNGTFTSVSIGSGAGRYEFYTLAVDTSGNTEVAPAVGSPDAFTVLDVTAPTSVASSLTTPRTTTSVSITYTASDNTNGTGVVSVDLYQRFQAAGSTTWSTWAPVQTATTSPISVTLSLGDGRYEFYTRALDFANNREAAAASFDAYTILDTRGPVSSASALAAGTKSTTLSVPYTAADTGGNGVASVELYERFQAAGSSNWSTYTNVATATVSPFSVALGLGVGRYEFYTLAVDSLGNREVAPGPADAFTVLDTTVPTSAVSPLPAFVTSTALSVPYTAADTNGSGISKVDLYQRYEAAGSTTWSSYSKVGSPGTSTTGTFSISLGLGAGTYRFYTLATDVAGNVEAAPSVADASIVLDVAAPTSLIPAPGLPSTSSATSVSVAYTASDNTNGSGFASVECWARYKASDGATPGAWTTCGTATAASGSFTLTFGSGAGIYNVLTVAVDVAGNREGALTNPPASGAAPKSSVRSVNWAPAAKVNTDTGTALQDNAAYVVGSDGILYAVWEDGRNGNTDIYFNSRNPSTGVWAAEIKLNTDTGTAGQRTPSIAIDGSGNLYVVWADDRNGSANTDIYFAKRTGTIWSANIKVNSDTATAIQNSPRISVSSAGIAVAVWYDARSSQVNIYSARLPAGSTTWSTNYNVTTSNTSAVKAAPDVAVASDGTAWATWQDNRTGGGDIYVASLGPTATSWSTNTKVSDDSGSSSLDKSARIGLTSASPNQPVVAYLDGRTTNAQVRVVNHTTSAWNASVQVNDTSAKPASGLALAVKADGGIIVSWDDTRSTSAIWGAQCEVGSGTSSVTRCGPGEKWSDQTGASSHPTIVASTTQVYLGWRDDTTGGGDIRLRLRNPS